MTSQTTVVGTGASSAGSQNTALGFNALQGNASGNQNTATGSYALAGNSTGNNNVAVGASALLVNATGSANTAIGAYTLVANAIANGNTAVGFSALSGNTVGASNTALGTSALYGSSTGSYNVALGSSALAGNTSGSWNIALGYQAGSQITTGSNNIDIGNQAQSADSNVIRIGTPGTQTSSYIAGISSANVSGSAVIVNSNGQLGVTVSSERYKEDIRDMDSASEALMLLRPVTFRYKEPDENGHKALHYGLIGEEVEKVYPELVTYSRAGQVESVQYHQLPALLLNELQKQRRTIDDLQARLAALEARLK